MAISGVKEIKGPIAAHIKPVEKHAHWKGREVKDLDKFDKTIKIIADIILIGVGILFAAKGHPYIGGALIVAGAYGFYANYKEAQYAKKSAELKAQKIEALGGRANFEALPEVKWTNFGKKPFFDCPIIKPEDMTQKTMRLVENGETIALASYSCTKEDENQKFLHITSFKKAATRTFMPKLSDMPGWSSVCVKDCIESRSAQ